jgi:hypothetical protein
MAAPPTEARLSTNTRQLPQHMAIQTQLVAEFNAEIY